MRGPILTIVAAVAVLSCVREAHAAPCTTPTPACASSLPPPAAEPPRPAQRPRAAPPGAKRRAFLELYARTAECMRQGSVAAIRVGARNRDEVTDFTMKTCGKPMYDWFVREEGLSREQAASAIVDMTDKALDAALRGPDGIIIRN